MTKRINVSSKKKGNGTYRFMDKDPIIDICRQAVKESRLRYSDIENKAGVSTGLLTRWFTKDTRRPQHITVKFILDACNVKYVAVREDGSQLRGIKQ